MPACFVKGCHNSDRKKKQGVTFHNFSKTLQSEWLSAVGRDPDLLIVHQKICSEHFNVDDFEEKGMRKRIKSNIIPTKNLPQQSPVGETMITGPRVSSEKSKQPILFLDHLASASKIMRVEGKMQPGLIKMFSKEIKESAVSKQIYSTTSCNINNISVKQMASSPLLVMISNSSTTEVKHSTENIILDFQESKENIKTNLNAKEDSDPSCPSRQNNECIVGLSSAFRTYSFNPGHYLMQIRKAQQRSDFYMRKYQNALKISIRRKKKILILKRVLRDLQERYRTLN